jgi:ATP-dependent helicase/nuclease subunit A
MAEPPASDQSTPPDELARVRIRSELASTLFVNAGAGSGKTTELVFRVLELVRTGEAELTQIAAITFTEKAAAELRDRIRTGLETLVIDHPGTPEAARCSGALDQLDGAAIGTLHAFAQRVLIEHPIEAELPPRIEVLDEVSSDVAFMQRWSLFQEQMLADPGLERTLSLFFAAGIRPEALRYLAQAFEDNWDLVEAQVPTVEPEPPRVHALLRVAEATATWLLAEPCSDPNDRLRRHIVQVVDRIREIAAIQDEVELLEALEPGSSDLPSFRVGNFGRLSCWTDVRAIRSAVAELGEQVAGVRTDVAAACARRLGCEIRRFTLSAALERQSSGQLRFHDLLVLARGLLRNSQHGARVRANLHDRYQRLLLDEFQDTDPIQIELAVRIAAADPSSDAAGALPWQAVEVEPGRLFVVGDPKQSIYRFRRADISTFLEASEVLGGGDGVVTLTANFRAGEQIIEWVNSTFGSLMSGQDADDLSVRSQPPYVALAATRRTASSGFPVSILGRGEHPKETTADELRALEAKEVADAAARILQQEWAVEHRAGAWRAAKPGDIVILVPARTSLPFLEEALDDAHIPFRTESSSLVYASRSVRDLLMVLRAVDDPTNTLDTVAALRTPLLGCGDDDLFRFSREQRGRWNYLGDQPESVRDDDPVRVGLDYLRELYELRTWLPPSQLLDRIARDRRALELGFSEGRPRDTWRRLRFVIDQARAWSEATGGNLREYLSWVAQQASDGARVAEAILPETDDDAVSIMTIHAAKGLEFPIAIVSGMSTAPRRQPAPAQVLFPPTGGVGYRFRDVTTEEYEAWKPIDEQMGYHERIRLLYVACTRARDHLVVSLHRKGGTNHAQESNRTNAELLVGAMGQRVDDLSDASEDEGPLPSVVVERPLPPPPFDEWFAELTAALGAAALPRTVAATALSDEGTFDVEAEPDPGLQKRPRDLDLPPWLKGRYGSAVGRAVHAVLQTIDLETDTGIDSAVAAQCEAEAVNERLGDVRELVISALGAPSVREAAASPHWREVYVCAPIGARLLEGYIDLLYRTPDGLVVIDYKTSASSDSAELDRRTEVYSRQGASYALAVASATGERVVRVTFVFLTPTGAVERHLVGLDQAVDRTRELVSEGREIVVG